MKRTKLVIPKDGEKITANADLSLNVPNHPIIPFIEGDGTGIDITPVMLKVVDAAVQKAYGGRAQASPGWRSTPVRRLQQVRHLAPRARPSGLRDLLVGIKGPLTTPVGGGIRSLNVALRQTLDLYTCVRPVRWFNGRARARQAARTDRHGDLPREHRGHLRRHRVPTGSHRVQKLIATSCRRTEASREIRFPETSGIGIKPVSRRRAPSASSARPRSSTRSTTTVPSVTLVHKGNIMKYTEGAFRTGATSSPRTSSARPNSTADRGCKDAPSTQSPNRQGQGRQDRHQGRHRRRLPAADAHPPRRVRRHRHAEPQRRLHLRRARGPGRRHRHRPRRQHRTRPRGVRGHPRHGPQVRRQGQVNPGSLILSAR
jgi:isocitrate dehydrogenase